MLKHRIHRHRPHRHRPHLRLARHPPARGRADRRTGRIGPLPGDGAHRRSRRAIAAKEKGRKYGPRGGEWGGCRASVVEVVIVRVARVLLVL